MELKFIKVVLSKTTETSLTVTDFKQTIKRNKAL